MGLSAGGRRQDGRARSVTVAILDRRPLSFAADCPYIEAGLDWHRSGAAIHSDDDRLAELFPQIQICNRDGGFPPSFLYVGQESLTSIVFGDEFALRSAGVAGVPDADYERAVNAAYMEVADTLKPTLHRIKSTMRPAWGGRIGMIYDRLIVPCAMRSGLPAFAIFSTPSQIFELTSTPATGVAPGRSTLSSRCG